MEFLGCTDELIAMLPLDEKSCEDQTFVAVFVFEFSDVSLFTRMVSDNP